MRAKILDEFIEGNSICYLSSVSLEDYVKFLPKDYKDYEVQREIVNNAYLDALINTITGGKHIPPIVLVVEDGFYSIDDSYLNIQTFKILDGLQRTFRLKVIYDTIKVLESSLLINDDALILTKLQLAKAFKSQLEEINSSTSILVKLIDYYKSNSNNTLEPLYNRNQWFEIWIKLTPEDEVNKMLILNAGHKAVKTKHQLELLFRNILPILEKIELPKFQIIKEKEASSFKLIKDRKPGQFLFSNLITSLLSFSEAKPVTTNIDLIQKSQNEQYGEEIFVDLLQLDFLKLFLKSLITFDENLNTVFGTVGTQWLGRETSLVGIFAAIGKYAKTKDLKPIESLESFNLKITSDVSILKLDQYEEVRNSQDLAKINFGLINKRAVYNSVFEILAEDQVQINWSYYFNNESK